MSKQKGSTSRYQYADVPPSYNSFISELANARYRARKWCHNFNSHFPSGPDDTAETLLAHRQDALKEILGKVGEGAYLEPPLYLDYGCNVTLGERFYANFNLTILDCGLVTM